MNTFWKIFWYVLGFALMYVTITKGVSNADILIAIVLAAAAILHQNQKRDEKPS